MGGEVSKLPPIYTNYPFSCISYPGLKDQFNKFKSSTKHPLTDFCKNYIREKRHTDVSSQSHSEIIILNRPATPLNPIRC